MKIKRQEKGAKRLLTSFEYTQRSYKKKFSTIMHLAVNSNIINDFLMAKNSLEQQFEHETDVTETQG